jgi:pentatricopeptide repeat protein
VGVLNAHANVVPSGEEGRCVHQQIIECAWDSYIFVVNSLVDLYAKCGIIKDAWRVFNKMPSQDVVIWNAMLGGCAMHGHGKEALKHFEQMCEGVQPDDIIFICPLSVCSHAGLVDEGMCCYASMVTDYMISVKLEHYTCMVNLLSYAGHLQEAENMVMAMPCKQHVAHGWFCLALTEFMVMWRWQNTLQNEFLKWSLIMLLVMCCCQTPMLVVATGISMKMLSGRE